MNNNPANAEEDNVGTSVDLTQSLVETLCENNGCKTSNENTCNVSNDNDVSTSGNADDVDTENTCNVSDVCVYSSSSSCCRICQIGGEDESLTTSRCFCRGHLAKVHHSCLSEWVQYRGSNRCEICRGIFLDIPAPPIRNVDLRDFSEQIGGTNLFPEQQEYLYYQALEYVRHELPQFQLSRRKRTAVVASVVFLLLITIVSAILTVGASRTFQKINNDPVASVDDIRKNHVVFSICLSFSFFCVTLTLGLTVMWLVLECYFHVQRRRLLRRTAERFLLQRRRIPRSPEVV